MKVWVLHEIHVLHAILCHDRGTIYFQTSFEEFHVSQCETSLLTNSLCALPVFFNFSIIAVKTGSFSVALFRLPDYLSEFNWYSACHKPVNQNALNFDISILKFQSIKFQSSNFDILEISSYAISLKVAFSLLSTVNLFNLNEFVRIDIFKRETWTENWFWKALLSSLHFKGSKASAISGVLSYSLTIIDSSCNHSSHRANPDSSSLLSNNEAPPIPFITVLFCSWAWSIPTNENFLFDFWKAKLLSVKHLCRWDDVDGKLTKSYKKAVTHRAYW